MAEFPILLVDDDLLDTKAVQRALRAIAPAHPLHIVRDGQHALDFLRSKNPDNGSTRPGLILLDLRMPRLDGFGFLRIVRSDPALGSIPIVVFTTSHEPRERFESFLLGASGFIQKPDDEGSYRSVMRITVEYWKLCLGGAPAEA